MGVVVQLLDGLRNFASGLGVSGQAKQTAAHYHLSPITRMEIDACYRGTWLGRKIHDIPAKDMTREWRGWQAEDDQIEAIEKEEKRLQLRARVRRALILSRLYGGAAIIMGLPGEAESPAPTKIGKGGLRYLHVMHRHDLTIGEQVRRPDEPLFGQPDFFRINTSMDGSGNDVLIHPSRVISLIGNELPDGSMGLESEGWFWGDPLLLAVRDAIAAHDTSAQAIAELLQEAKIDVIHIPGLMDQLSTAAFEKTLTERFTLAAVIKSITNALILDGGDGSEGGGEKWETRQLNFEGLPDVQRTMFQLVAGAADIPATRLIGQSPVGMNATGESDIRNYYDRLSSEQKSDLTPALAPLDEYLIQSATGARDPAIFFEWHPLWQMTPKEKAERDKMVAETTEKYAHLGLVPADALSVAVQNRLIEDGVYPGLEAAIEEAEMEAEALAEVDPEEQIEIPDPANDPAPDPSKPPMSGNSRRRAANDRARKRIRSARATDRLGADAKPRPLYVSRKVLNAEAIRTWAEGQGFKAILPAEKMHVTVAASRSPVDWMQMGESWGGPNADGSLLISAGGPRVVERLGDAGAPVLMFNSWELTSRHDYMSEKGASWDFDSYQPHISISYDGEANRDIDLDAIEPYSGPIRLGPEIFEEFSEDA